MLGIWCQLHRRELRDMGRNLNLSGAGDVVCMAVRVDGVLQLQLQFIEQPQVTVHLLLV